MKTKEQLKKEFVQSVNKIEFSDGARLGDIFYFDGEIDTDFYTRLDIVLSNYCTNMIYKELKSNEKIKKYIDRIGFDIDIDNALEYFRSMLKINYSKDILEIDTKIKFLHKIHLKNLSNLITE